MILDHLQRVKDRARDTYNLANMSTWIEKYIVVEGKLMNLHGKYAFQADIVDDTARVNNTVKCAQIGATTATIAFFLSALATQKKFNVIYALPTASDAAKLTTTKVDPMISGSERLRSMLSKDVDSVELKKIGSNFLFTRGSKSDTAALSISADCLVADEVDRADPAVLKQYRSRLQASEIAVIRQFSTPTIAGVGISKEAEASKRYRSFGKCNCCGHIWLPTYENDIRIPNYKGELFDITKHTIKDLYWQGAHWQCPKCGRDPKFTAAQIEWVCENPLDNYEANTRYITPVTCCEVLKPSYLVRTYTEYDKKSEWRNQVLGEVAEDKNEQLNSADLDTAFVQADLGSSEVHYLGVDMGLVCTFTVGRMTAAGELLVVKRVSSGIAKFIETRNALIAQYKCVVSVHDVYPYTSEVMRICDYDPNAFGCVFTTSKSPELFTVQDKTETPEAGKLNLHLVKANRTRALDELLTLFKQKKIVIAKQDDTEDGIYRQHLLSMKRTQVFVGDELAYVWQKTDGEDHYMFSTLYMYLACRLRGTVSPTLDAMGFIVAKFKVRG